MEAKKLAETCAKLALDKKGENILILDLGNKSSVADYFVLVTATNDRQVRAIAESLSDDLRKQGVRSLSEEGLGDAKWALVDFGAVIVHVFQDAWRDYYNLESLWPNANRQRVVEDPSKGAYVYPTGDQHA